MLYLAQSKVIMFLNCMLIRIKSKVLYHIHVITISESIGLFSGGFSVVFNDMTCIASIFDEIASESTMRCLQVCSITDNCAAVSYMKEDRACQLLTSTIGCVVYKKGSLIHIKQPCQ